MAKYNGSGIRLCDQNGCKQQATHWLVWTKPQVYCGQHAEAVLHIAEVMGHPTPMSTLRALRPDEQSAPADLFAGGEVVISVSISDDLRDVGDLGSE